VILPGTTTAISGTINGCVFTPNANQPIPSNVTLGNGGTATLVIPGIGSVSLPINTVAGAGTVNNPGTPINTINNQPVTGANPISGITGGTITPISLTGGNVASGTPATFTCQGSNTVINGSIVNNQFVASSGTYPINANLGNTLCTISITGGPSVNVPVVLTAPVGTVNNPGTPVNPVNNQPVTVTNPVVTTVGGAVPTIPFTGGNVPAGTPATLFLPGSATPIQGTINANGQFVPNGNQTIPSDVAVGSGNSRIVIKDGPTINVPTTITPRTTTPTTTSSSSNPVNNLNLPSTNNNNNTNGSGTTQTTGASNNPTTVATNPNGVDPVTGNPINNSGALARSGLAGTGIGSFANPAEYFNQPSQALKTPLPTAQDEDKGPNNGDGNYDGIKDSTQDNVVTIPTALGNSFVTGVFTGEGECSNPEQFMMKKETEQTKIDSNYDYIYGLVDFKVKCAKTTTLKTYWHGLNSFQNNNFTYRKLGNKTPGVDATKEYFTITPTLGSDTLGGKQLATATYSVTDGEFGDDTAKDGIIIDPAGPALDPQSVSAFLPSTARTGGDTIIKILIPAIALMTILTLAYSRRRRVQESDLDIE
jgi:hypothetical protein